MQIETGRRVIETEPAHLLDATEAVEDGVAVQLQALARSRSDEPLASKYGVRVAIQLGVRSLVVRDEVADAPSVVIAERGAGPLRKAGDGAPGRRNWPAAGTEEATAHLQRVLGLPETTDAHPMRRRGYGRGPARSSGPRSPGRTRCAPTPRTGTWHRRLHRARASPPRTRHRRGRRRARAPRVATRRSALPAALANSHDGEDAVPRRAITATR